MESSSELLKSFANRVAEASVTETGAQTLRLLQLTGLMSLPSDSTPQQKSSGKSHAPNVASDRSTELMNSKRVGIWEWEKDAGCFSRRMDMYQEWGLWANAPQIKPKGTKQRVVLVGESVARGYFYDPQFTPAKALEAILRTHMGRVGVEVIDLARTSIGMEVRELAISALLLEPDVVIMFSGNNWGPNHSKADIPYINSILLEQGVAGLKRYCEERLAEAIEDLMGDVASIYEARKIPLIWVIPEFNLGDWRDPITNAPHLDDGLNQEWIACWEEARAALQAGNISLASERAARMVALDGQVCVTGLYILAECSRRQGDRKMERHYLKCACDALRWDPSLKSPRPYSVTQNTLRKEAGGYGHWIVDLPEVFKEYLGGGIPDRRLFLDFCHMTTEGIQLAMAATASRVLSVLTGINVPWPTLISQSAKPSPKVEAEAAFLAAVHNSHWHQEYDLVLHYCLRSLQLAPSIAQVMALFLDLQCRRLPMMMCKSTEEIAGLEWPSIHHYLLRFNSQRLDKFLLDAIVSALGEAGVDAAGRLDQIRRDEHSVVLGRTNLLDYYYQSAANQPQEGMWVTPGLPTPKPNYYYKAYSPESKFLFVGDANFPVRLNLTCRLPQASPPEAAISIEINGKGHEEMVINREWTTWKLSIAAELVQSGLNEILIRWPTGAFPGKKGLEEAAADILQGIPPEFYCVFGEIHTFSVSGGPAHENESKGTAPL
jgi:hypothetical protein